MRRATNIVVAAAVIVASSVGCARTIPRDTVSPTRTEPIRVGGPPLPSQRFGSLFCGVLAHGADMGAWESCSTYFVPSGTPAALMPLMGPLPKYRVLVVPGIFGRCVENVATPFEDGRVHLRYAHGIDTELVAVSALGSTAYNARQIMTYLDDAFRSDSRPYIVFGYSKGASDVLEAIQRSPITRKRVAAIVTVAGSVLGSRLPDDVPRELVQRLRATQIGPCDFGDSGGVDSLRRKERLDMMSQFDPTIPPKTYSIAAISTENGTSTILRGGWRTLSGISLEQDSQMLHEDVIVPGGTYLGYAKGDHWAVALPFEHVQTLHPNTPEPVVRVLDRLVDSNHYPRASLFEAALRYVLADLP